MLCGAFSPVGRESWHASDDEKCWPSAGQCQAGREERVRPQEQTPAMALGLNDQLWRLEVVVLIRVPPWPPASLACSSLPRN